MLSSLPHKWDPDQEGWVPERINHSTPDKQAGDARKLREETLFPNKIDCTTCIPATVNTVAHWFTCPSLARTRTRTSMWNELDAAFPGMAASFQTLDHTKTAFILSGLQPLENVPAQDFAMLSFLKYWRAGQD